ncbi:MAG: antibiotic biosynthesis monooxygenase [Rivularia sp. (in: Bacteria)]|nr:antibiotic biosynthesis monooxygenase [Rivularia sp. MS3]
MPKINLSQDTNYVTMINYFSVAPKDQREFAEIEVKEINKYGDNMDGALAASFHRSLEGSRVFNYAHWKSKEALEASQQTEEFKQHIQRMSYLDFTPDARVFAVISIDSLETPEISQKDAYVPTLTMIYTDENKQSEIIKKLQNQNILKQNEHIISSHILRSLDGDRVAVYVQNPNLSVAKSIEGSFEYLTELADKIETLPYEILGSYN